MPANPTLSDFFKLRFIDTSNHVLQSAHLAMKNGMSEEIILACLLHDVVQEIIRTDHGWWGAQLFEPYVSEKVASQFATIRRCAIIPIRQSVTNIRISTAAISAPTTFRRLTSRRPTRWCASISGTWTPRLVTVNDLYAFDPNAVVSIEPFVDIIGRHFKQPKEGLGNDGSPVAHMWRTIAGRISRYK